VTGGLRPPASIVPARWAWGNTAGPLGLRKSWGLSDRGTSSPGIHCAGPLGLKKIVSARWACGKLCRPVGHGENCVGLLGIGNHCRLAEP
jgi:hypothetical protein